MAILLDQIIPWGRSRHEYDLMFRLAFEDLSAGVLDCGGGPASFTAELSVSGIRAISVDPVYVFSGLEIQGRFEAVVEPMLSQIRATPGDWTWTYHRDASINISSNSRMERRGGLAIPVRKYGGESNENSVFVIGGNSATVQAIPERLPLKDLIIYEMMIDDFTAESATRGKIHSAARIGRSLTKDEVKAILSEHHGPFRRGSDETRGTSGVRNQYRGVHAVDGLAGRQI